MRSLQMGLGLLQQLCDEQQNPKQQNQTVFLLTNLRTPKAGYGGQEVQPRTWS